MSSTRIAELIAETKAAFDRPPTDIEAGLDTDSASLVQLRKACRLLSGADMLREQSHYTLVIEASFGAIERTIEFRLLERGAVQPDDLPGTHSGVYRDAAALGIFDESVASELAALWREYRAKTYYQDGLATADRADRMSALAHEIHAFVVGRSSQGHACLCE